MLMALFQLLVRLAIACFLLAMRLVLAIAALIGTLLGHLLVGLWRYWRNRQAASVPLRAPKHITAEVTELQSFPTPAPIPFTPRPLRPRPKR